MEVSRGNSSTHNLKIALCPPEYRSFSEVMCGKSVDATNLILKYVATGLKARGHNLTFVAPHTLDEMICTDNFLKPELATRTWSANILFNTIASITWRIQHLLHVPYLNFFSNYRIYDACMQCLPGHDVVYERNSMYKYGVAMACRRLKIPYVLYFEADDILEHEYMKKPITGLLRWRTARALRYNLKAADCIVCVSDQGKNHLVTNWNIPGGKIKVFPNAADTQRFRPYPETRLKLRASLKIVNNPLIVFVGTFYIWHDIATLLNAFSQVRGTYPDARLILIGDGAHRQNMMNLADEMGISNAVQFPGRMAHDEIPRILGAADIAVAPYPNMADEMWLSPIKLFEYMASGLAVIATEIGQLTEIIKNGYNGMLVPPQDVSAMSTTIKMLIENPELCSHLGQHAREDVIKKYSWESYVSRLERLFAAVIAGEPFNQI